MGNDMKIKKKRPLEDFLSVKVENPGKMNASNEKAFSRLEDIERPCKAPRIENIQLLKKHGNTGQNILENSVAPMSVEKSEASDSHGFMNLKFSLSRLTFIILTTEKNLVFSLGIK